MAIEPTDVIDVKSLTPFKKFIMTIGNIPTSYLESMSYAELLMWFCNYLQNTVIPTVNNNGEAVEELQRLYEELRTYVNDYFDNLDVQNEINNKLDEMVTSGELQALLNEQYNSLRNEVNNTLDEQNSYINNLQNQINNKVNNPPIVVTSTDNMTDTSKIYVLTTNGYWYYYNGSAWTQGGLYQASQSTDDVEKIKDYIINNNLKNVMDWVVGDITSSGISSNAYRIATNSIQYFPYDLYINIDSDTKTFIWVYDDASGTNPTSKGWYQDEKRPMIIPAGTYFRLLREYINQSNPDRVALTNAFNSVLFNRTYIYNYYEYQERLTQAKHDYENIKYNILFNIGEITNGRPNIQQAMNRRILTQDIQCFDFDIVLPKSKDGECDAWYLVTYENGDETQYTNVGWCNQNADYVISAGTYFRMLGSVYNLQSTAVVGNLFTSNIYDYIQIYKTDLNRPKQIFYNNNFDSIAHQGYVTNDTVGHSTVQAMKNAKLHGFNYGECDIKFSSDNVPVCCHDDTFISNGTTITISDHTYAELITYNYYGSTIASLEDIVKTCKEIGLGLYIDQLPVYNETRYNIIFSIIDKYEMSNHVKWLTTNETVIAQILNKYNNASIVLVTSESDLTNIIALANNIKTDLNHISIDVWKEVVTVSNIQTIKQQLNANISIEVWTIDNETDYKSYLPYVSAITSNKVCYNDVYNDLMN